MSRRERRTILLALTILRGAAKMPPDRSAQTEAVQLALRVLLAAVDSRDLVTFWRAAGDEGGWHRSFRLKKLFDGIETAALRRIAGA